MKNKKDLTKAVADNLEAQGFALPSHAQAERCVNAVVEEMTKAIVEDDGLMVVGFGTFKKATRAARVGTNPSTGEKMDIPEKTVVKFVPGSALKDAVNE